ncbi:MAG: AAA family ATPase [Bacilli bacterium]
MIVLAGASASGKTEVAKLLAKKYNIIKAITTTTRKIRKGEVDGVDYFFVSVEKFLEKIKNGDFVEYTMFNNNYYGSTKDQISSNKVVVIDPAGLRSYISLKDDKIVTFFLETEENTRFERMLLRGDKIDDAKSRILHDREAFKKEQIAKVDFTVNSQTQNVEEVTDEIYQKYHEELKRRNID